MYEYKQRHLFVTGIVDADIHEQLESIDLTSDTTRNIIASFTDYSEMGAGDKNVILTDGRMEAIKNGFIEVPTYKLISKQGKIVASHPLKHVIQNMVFTHEGLGEAVENGELSIEYTI